jgi:hypothetical protein
MAQKKSNSRLGELEAQKRATQRQEQRIKRWQQIAFIAISVIVLLSMVLTLFMNP